MKKATRIVTVVIISLLGAFCMTGCAAIQSADTNAAPVDLESQIEKTHFLTDMSRYEEFVEGLPVAPNFEAEDLTSAAEAYRNASELTIKKGKLYFDDTNYVLVGDNQEVRIVNNDSESHLMVDVKLFRSEANKLTFVGCRAIDTCRTPYAVTVMEDGTILGEKEYDNVSSIDTIGLEEGEVLVKGQYVTLVQNGTKLSFYRYGEEMSSYEMPKKIDGSYSSVFIGQDNTLYLTIMSTRKEKPFLQIAKVDEGVKRLTGDIFDKKENYAFPIYVKEVDGTEVEYTALMDMATYNAYVYMLYPNSSDLTVQPSTSFQIIQPKDYDVPTTETEQETIIF